MIDLKDVEAGSVLVDRKGILCLVTELFPNRPGWPFDYALKASGSLYKGRLDEFRAVIGKADIAAFKAASTAPVEPPARKDPSEIFPGLIPEPLRKCKKGDFISVRHGNRVVQATYEGYVSSRPKYPVTYSINGKCWKGPVSIVVS